jgi:hypothetical protein
LIVEGTALRGWRITRRFSKDRTRIWTRVLSVIDGRQKIQVSPDGHPGKGDMDRWDPPDPGRDELPDRMGPCFLEVYSLGEISSEIKYLPGVAREVFNFMQPSMLPRWKQTGGSCSCDCQPLIPALLFWLGGAHAEAPGPEKLGRMNPCLVPRYLK